MILGAATRGGFESMVRYTAPVFCSSCCWSRSRSTSSAAARPAATTHYRVPLYPVTPAILALTCLLDALSSCLAYAGLGSIVGVVILLLGTPLLFLKRTAA